MELEKHTQLWSGILSSIEDEDFKKIFEEEIERTFKNIKNPLAFNVFKNYLSRLSNKIETESDKKVLNIKLDEIICELSFVVAKLNEEEITIRTDKYGVYILLERFGRAITIEIDVA